MATRKKSQQAGPSYYQIMGVARTFTAAQLKTNWHALSRQLHPDRNLTEDTTEAFAEVSAAYATLSDPTMRKAYDAKLDLLTVRCPACNGEGQIFKQCGFSARRSSICPDCNGAGVIV